MRILFDTNVLLDVLLARSEFLREAAILFDAVEKNRLTGLVSSTTVTTLSYFLEKAYGAEQRARDLVEIIRLFEVVSVGRPEIERALGSKIQDYEDAVIHETAVRNRVTGIVTRNVGDFSGASIPIYHPRDLVAALELGVGD